MNYLFKLFIVIIYSRPSQFYLVLDVCNATQHEMELQYAKSKQILVEKSETCRIPVPLDKCSLLNTERGGVMLKMIAFNFYSSVYFLVSFKY